IVPRHGRDDCDTDQAEEIGPAERPVVVRDPAEFGDHWDEPLEAADVAAAEGYFRSIERLGTVLDFVNLRVGDRDNCITLGKRKFNRGVTFEAPRHSLVTALHYEIFDDLLIGNFMKTTLHGSWGPGRLYPDFTPFVAKYADNGRAKSERELADYFKAYRKRALLDFLKYSFEKKAEAIFRSYVTEESIAHRLAKNAYWLYKK